MVSAFQCVSALVCCLQRTEDEAAEDEDADGGGCEGGEDATDDEEERGSHDGDLKGEGAMQEVRQGTLCGRQVRSKVVVSRLATDRSEAGCQRAQPSEKTASGRRRWPPLQRELSTLVALFVA